MTPISNLQIRANIVRRISLLLLGLIFKSTSLLYGQCDQPTNVAIDLSNYTPGQILTDAICISVVQFVPPDVHVFIDGVSISSIPWLDFSTTIGADLQVNLFVKPGQCVPVPAAAGICSTPVMGEVCGLMTPPVCSAVAGYASALRSRCYRVCVQAYGNFTIHSLCVFGPGPLNITGPATTQAKNGETVSIPLSILRSEESYSWSLDEAPISYLTFTDATGKDAALQFVAPDADLAEQTFHITVKNDLQSCDVGKLTIKVSSKGDAVFTGGPVDIVLVVDVSGSMGEKAECACKGQQGCPDPPNKTKLRYLIEQIKKLHEEMAKLARSTDRIGLVSFHTTSKIEKNLIPFTDNSLLTVVDGWNDNGYDMTSIAGGLKDAVSLLTDASHKRYIILMTNGIQTEPPYLEWTNGSESTVKAGSTVFDNNLGIRVIPIAIFSPDGNYRKLLNALGTGTGASVVRDVCESNLSLLQAYTDAAKPMGSPKLVTFKRGVFSGTVATGTYTVDENIDKMLVSIINVGNQNFSSFKIEKNIANTWVDITSLGSITPAMAQPAIRRLFVINFPAILSGSPLNSSGEYRYTVNSSLPGIPYEFSVMIDDGGVKHSVYTGIQYYQSGDPLNLAASVFFNGLPVTNASVIVSLESPVVSFSSNFSKANISGIKVTKVPLNERAKTGGFGVPYINHYAIKNTAIDALGNDGNRMNNADRKYFVLRHETDFGAVFRATGNTIPLTHQSNGIYKGQFTATKNVGLYTMHFLITGNVPGVGNITRMDAKDVFVNFGKPVLDKSNLYVMWEQPVLISFTPRDGNDNLLGPGQGDQISIYMSKGSASAPNDYLDGRYVVQLLGITGDDNPDIIIRINKDVLYNGKLSGLSRKRGFVSIQGGYDFPQGTLATGFNSSFMGELKVGYRFWKKLGLQAGLGYYSFKGKPSISNQSIIGGALGAFYRFPLTNSQGWNMIAEVNGGYYKPKNVDGAFGLNGGIGLNAFITYKLSLLLEGKYYTIYTKPDNMNFIGSTIGLKFHF